MALCGMPCCRAPAGAAFRSIEMGAAMVFRAGCVEASHPTMEPAQQRGTVSSVRSAGLRPHLTLRRSERVGLAGGVQMTFGAISIAPYACLLQ